MPWISADQWLRAVAEWEAAEFSCLARNWNPLMERGTRDPDERDQADWEHQEQVEREWRWAERAERAQETRRPRETAA